MGIADQKPLNMTSRGICNESYWQTINVVDTCRKRATKPAAKVIAKARHAWNGDGEEGTTVKTFHSISSPEESSTQFKVFVQKQAWNKTCCNAQDQQTMIHYLPPGRGVVLNKEVWDCRVQNKLSTCRILWPVWCAFLSTIDRSKPNDWRLHLLGSHLLKKCI